VKFLQDMQKNPQLAKRVKQLRVEQEFSWGMVGQIISEEFPELKIHVATFHEMKIGNQLVGTELCDAAMKYFDEKIEEGWN